MEIYTVLCFYLVSSPFILPLRVLIITSSLLIIVCERGEIEFSVYQFSCMFSSSPCLNQYPHHPHHHHQQFLLLLLLPWFPFIELVVFLFEFHLVRDRSRLCFRISQGRTKPSPDISFDFLRGWKYIVSSIC